MLKILRCRIRLGFFLAGVMVLCSGLGAFGEVSLEGRTLYSAPGGSMVAPEDFLGGPVLMIFFTPSCPACEKELKSLDPLVASYKEKWNLTVLPVAPGVLKSQAARLAEFVRERWGISRIPVYVDGEPSLMEAHKVEYVPTLVLYDAQGKEIWKQTGAVPVAALEKELAKAVSAE